MCSTVCTSRLYCPISGPLLIWSLTREFDRNMRGAGWWMIPCCSQVPRSGSQVDQGGDQCSGGNNWSGGQPLIRAGREIEKEVSKVSHWIKPGCQVSWSMCCPMCAICIDFVSGTSGWIWVISRIRQTGNKYFELYNYKLYCQVSQMLGRHGIRL